ncbi:MAG TPA: hypothetical protein VFA70_15380, partial [Dehalococcoidia bacterium]|nr:hypothetical protein [Dehalococcoidia bacterium]
MLLLIGLLALGWIVYRLRETVLLLGLALMLMATLHPFVVMLQHRGLSHGKAVAAVLLGAVLLPLAVIAALSPLIISEVAAFAASFPTFQRHINEL